MPLLNVGVLRGFATRGLLLSSSVPGALQMSGLRTSPLTAPTRGGFFICVNKCRAQSAAPVQQRTVILAAPIQAADSAAFDAAVSDVKNFRPTSGQAMELRVA